MILTMNGEEISLPSGIAVSEYLGQKGYRTDRIAVEYNGAILPRARYQETILKDGDRVEVVSFVGGG